MLSDWMLLLVGRTVSKGWAMYAAAFGDAIERARV